MSTLNKKWQILMRKINRRYAIWRLLRRYSYLREVETIMESWVTKRIVDGQKGRREELREKQDRIEEMDLLINYLRKL